MTDLEQQGTAAKKAAAALSWASTREKNQALLAIADALEQNREPWLAANQADLAAAEASGMGPSLLDRLRLTPERIGAIAQGVRQVAQLADPIGVVDQQTERPNGLVITRRRVPLGVIGIIFEARPNVAVDAAALCLKSGNACILRGGREAFRSNVCAVGLMRQALADSGLPEDAVSLVMDTSRASATELMHLTAYLDVLIPRGGPGLIRTAVAESTVPVIRTGEGVCHIYVDADADLDMAANILCNAKCSRPSVCNAAECVLIHRDVAEPFLRKAVPLLDGYSVELRCDEESLALLGSRGVPAEETDWGREFGDYTLAVRIVADIREAMDYIQAHGTGHSEAIVTENPAAARRFQTGVDAAAVYVNASTRFTDGFEFGLGAEIGISTQKLHARGPMGLSELTSYKYCIQGTGQVR